MNTPTENQSAARNARVFYALVSWLAKTYYSNGHRTAKFGRRYLKAWQLSYENTKLITHPFCFTVQERDFLKID